MAHVPQSDFANLSTPQRSVAEVLDELQKEFAILKKEQLHCEQARGSALWKWWGTPLPKSEPVAGKVVIEEDKSKHFEESFLNPTHSSVVEALHEVTEGGTVAHSGGSALREAQLHSQQVATNVQNLQGENATLRTQLQQLTAELHELRKELNGQCKGLKEELLSIKKEKEATDSQVAVLQQMLQQQLQLIQQQMKLQQMQGTKSLRGGQHVPEFQADPPIVGLILSNNNLR
eukprot:EG_transcript_12529